MTKTIIIGNPEKTKNLKPIVFEAFIAARNLETKDRREPVVTKNHENYTPSKFNYVELIVKSYFPGAAHDVDLMFAYDNPNDRSSGYLFLGRWNDGVVQ